MVSSTVLILALATATVSASSVQVGVRPYFLVEQMKESPLKEELLKCADEISEFQASDFSIGHRGACMQFPEHSKRSYQAAAQMGAGIVECDVTFTKDRELVCRHSQCDLHTTTDVLLNPKLAKKCTKNFIPADKSESGSAEATCCTSDFTLEEIKSLCAKMDASNPLALTPEEYVIGATADWRTDLYSFECPQIVTHKESIELINSLGGKFTPELKTPSVEMPYEGDYTQEMFAQQMIDDYVEAGIDPSHVWPQSFLWDDIYYWIQNTEYGTQAVALDGCADVGCPETAEDLKAYFAPLVENEVNIIAPPQQVLVQPTKDGKGMEPSLYTETIKELGLDIITWTFERAGPLSNDPIGYYYSTIEDVVNGDGDSMELLHVLAQDVGILGIFSDWAAPVTFYANCMGLGLRDNEVSEKGN